MEVLRFGEALPNRTGADNLSVHFNHAAVRLPWENQLGYPRHNGWIQQSQENGEHQRHSTSGSKFLDHMLLLYANPSTARILSISQMPGNGTITPPSP